MIKAASGAKTKAELLQKIDQYFDNRDAKMSDGGSHTDANRTAKAPDKSNEQALLDYHRKPSPQRLDDRSNTDSAEQARTRSQMEIAKLGFPRYVFEA
jgi:hypothetical protein